MSAFKTSTASSSSYVKSGIGGAGNIRKSNTILPVQPTPRITVSRDSGIFLTGIGGIGNCHDLKERATVSYEEELALRELRKENAATTWHHGIGGAGNRASTESSRSTTPSIAMSSHSGSPTTAQSSADKIKEKLVTYLRTRSASSDKNLLDTSSVMSSTSYFSKQG
jgi:hypothetical protein